jgi:hypothetical protein
MFLLDHAVVAGRVFYKAIRALRILVSLAGPWMSLKHIAGLLCR